MPLPQTAVFTDVDRVAYNKYTRRVYVGKQLVWPYFKMPRGTVPDEVQQAPIPTAASSVDIGDQIYKDAVKNGYNSATVVPGQIVLPSGTLVTLTIDNSDGKWWETPNNLSPGSSPAEYMSMDVRSENKLNQIGHHDPSIKYDGGDGTLQTRDGGPWIIPPQTVGTKLLIMTGPSWAMQHGYVLAEITFAPDTSGGGTPAPTAYSFDPSDAYDYLNWWYGNTSSGTHTTVPKYVWPLDRPIDIAAVPSMMGVDVENSWLVTRRDMKPWGVYPSGRPNSIQCRYGYTVGIDPHVLPSEELYLVVGEWPVITGIAAEIQLAGQVHLQMPNDPTNMTKVHALTGSEVYLKYPKAPLRGDKTADGSGYRHVALMGVSPTGNVYNMMNNNPEGPQLTFWGSPGIGSHGVHYTFRKTAGDTSGQFDGDLWPQKDYYDPAYLYFAVPPALEGWTLYVVNGNTSITDTYNLDTDSVFQIDVVKLGDNPKP